jgi:hypothetical protein
MSKEILFLSKTINFGPGAYGVKFIKEDDKITAYNGVPQRGYKKISTVKATEELEYKLRCLNDIKDGLDQSIYIIEKYFIYNGPNY